MSIFSVKDFIRKYAAPVSAAALLPFGGPFAYAADTGDRAYFPPAPSVQSLQIAPMPLKPYRGICSSLFVRSQAKQRFARQIRHVPYEPRLSIKAFSDVAEVQYQSGPESYNIDRHYCSATVTMNDGQNYPAVYTIARNQGFAGIGGLHVSFCVTGLDNWLVRDNDCRSLHAPKYSVY